MTCNVLIKLHRSASDPDTRKFMMDVPMTAAVEALSSDVAVSSKASRKADFYT